MGKVSEEGLNSSHPSLNRVEREITIAPEQFTFYIRLIEFVEI